MIRFGSVCSGIEAASVAWTPLGWSAAWLAEIEPFPSAVLAHHWQHAPNLGDMTTISTRITAGDVEAPDVLCGGTPCQSFSFAGLRRGLHDPRGGLTLAFVELADAIDAARSVRGEQPCVVLWENVPGVLSDRGNAFGSFLAALAGADAPAIAFSAKDHGADAGDIAPTPFEMGHAGSHANGGGQVAVTARSGAEGDGTGRSVPITLNSMLVRRLTPRECERLQGFPDDYTAIPWRGKPASECPDGPRYKALGNSWAVPVVRWIGSRIDARLRGQE